MKTSETGAVNPGSRPLPPVETRFKRGVSGNPSGRPKKVVDVLELAKDGSTKAVEKLVKLIDSDDDRVALQACVAVLDRAMGKPKQTVETTERKSIIDLSTAELLAIARSGGAGTDKTPARTGGSSRLLTLHAEELPAGGTSRDDRREAGGSC